MAHALESFSLPEEVSSKHLKMAGGVGGGLRVPDQLVHNSVIR